VGRIGVVLEFIRDQLSNGSHVSDVKVDIGGNIVTARHAGGAGDDEYPLAGDYAVVVESVKSGGYTAVAYADTVNEPQATSGERRFYARDSEGSIVGTVWLRDDGYIRLVNDNGVFELEPGGNAYCSESLNVDGDISAGGNISAEGNISADGDVSDGVGSMAQVRQIYNSHTHTGNQGNPTSPPAQQM